MNYLELNNRMTLTEFRTEIEKGKALLDCMVGTLYRDMLIDDLNEGWSLFDSMLSERNGTPEHSAYVTFASNGIFQRIYDDAYDRITKFD